MDEQLRHQVYVLEAREAIKEQRSRYGWHAARGDYVAIARLFAPDCLFEFLNGKARVRMNSRAEIIDVLSKAMRPLVVFPLIHNEIIEIHGDTAKGTCAMETRTAPGYEASGFSGYYHDELRLIDGHWLFTQRLWYLYTPIFEDSCRELDGSLRDRAIGS